MPRTHGVEQYLEAIYILTGEGVTVLGSVLADYLNVSRPTITQTVQRLSNAGLVTMGAGKEISLTDEGLDKAETVVRRHRLLERWLSDELGLDWADAHVEAGRLEHAISPLVEQRLYERLGHPLTCPHGNLIPGTGSRQPHGMRLTDVVPPAQVEIIRIFEHAEEDLGLLRFLHQAGLIPGAQVNVNQTESRYEAGVPVEVNGQVYALDLTVAERIIVQPASVTQKSE
ncbi:metal-dependent transcriptional regulator [Alicyclobacillus ferrooxydans]|uniref:DtxR family transcriptional regulator n=1 Tax=Alicyclobacillus ferrooxydans TaxID=471514 RepID=A0A0P9CAA5_9BACL|nr:metal-dependent transcriptional regulator [Alicyclobacillus ferrooxydans]KPV42338.1 DtxR family transcriptional regulator [Alicyclobacillus ferrooxydans]